MPSPLLEATRIQPGGNLGMSWHRINLKKSQLYYIAIIVWHHYSLGWHLFRCYVSFKKSTWINNWPSCEVMRAEIPTRSYLLGSWSVFLVVFIQVQTRFNSPDTCVFSMPFGEEVDNSFVFHGYFTTHLNSSNWKLEIFPLLQVDKLKPTNFPPETSSKDGSRS